MAKLDVTSREILGYRPDISPVEPPVEPGDIEAQDPTEPPLSISEKRKQLRNFAFSLNLLAELLQQRIDERCKDFFIPLDPTVDSLVIQSMQRLFPDEDPTKITYQQYRGIKEDMLAIGQAAGAKMRINPEDIKKSKMPYTGLGGNGEATPQRPELDIENNPLEDLFINYQELQFDLLKMLANWLWDILIYTPLIRPLKALPLGLGKLFNGIPVKFFRNVPDIPKPFDIPDLPDFDEIAKDVKESFEEE